MNEQEIREILDCQRCELCMEHYNKLKEKQDVDN